MKFNTIKSVMIAAVLATGTLAASMSTAQAAVVLAFMSVAATMAAIIHIAQAVQTVKHKAKHQDAIRATHVAQSASPIVNLDYINRMVKRVNRKNIVVRGYTRGHSAKIVFKRTRHGCKVINTRGI